MASCSLKARRSSAQAASMPFGLAEGPAVTVPSESSVRRRHIPELDAARTAAMLAVIAIHVTSKPVLELTPASSAYPLYVLLNRLGSFAVPGFVFLSGLVLFHNYYDRPLDRSFLRSFFRRRVAAVVAPYVLWSVLYYLLHLLKAYGWPEGLGRFSIEIAAAVTLVGSAHYHLFFVVVLIQFYLLFPLLASLFRRFPQMWRYAVLGGIVVQWAFFLYATREGAVPPLKERICLSYLSHYLLGACAGMDYDRFTRRMDSGTVMIAGRRLRWNRIMVGLWAMTAFGHCFLYYRGYGYGDWHAAIWFELLWSAYTLLSAFLLVHWSRGLSRWGGPLLMQVVAALGTASFGIYLVHPLFLAVWERLIAGLEHVHYHLAVVAQFVVVTVVSWATVYTIKRWLPGAWLVFGLRRTAR